jgi:uncharacterized protein YbbC (DUF1343 family)
MPIAYGLTMGELADMAIGEGWLNLTSKPNYKVIKTSGWARDMLWPETGLEWIAPSPNLPTFEHAFAYPGTVILEGTNISEGRGTSDPFLIIGSPKTNFDTSALAKLEKKHSLNLEKVSFTPKSIPGKSAYPKHEDQQCTGISISFDGDYTQTDPVQLGLDLLIFMKANTPDFEIKAFANNLYGINLKQIIEQGSEIPGWEKEANQFKKQRKKYLLY